MYSAKSVARVGMMLIIAFPVSQKVKLNYDMLSWCILLLFMISTNQRLHKIFLAIVKVKSVFPKVFLRMKCKCEPIS